MEFECNQDREVVGGVVVDEGDVFDCPIVFFVYEDDVEPRSWGVVGPGEGGVSGCHAGVFHCGGEDVVGGFSSFEVEVAREDEGAVERVGDLDNALHLGESVGFVLVAEVGGGEGDFFSAPKRVINR